VPSAAGLAEFGVLLVAATGAKYLGVAIAARRVGMGGREAAALGTLMNARGLTELVILEVGRSAGILDEATFTALVGVAIVTTVLTGPVFRRLHRPEETRGDEGPDAGEGDPDVRRVPGSRRCPHPTPSRC
jgi:Kef-type K+ transport system membrane component KefB